VSFAAPGFLAAALAVAAAVAALHLLVLRPPPASLLPTARFVPMAVSVVRRRTRWPRDRAVLALRMATILLAGMAFAGPALGVHRSSLTRIVALDLAAPTARDSAPHYLRQSDVLIVFDSAAREVPAESLAALGSLGLSRGPGSLSAALVLARRVAARLRSDSIELVVISPFTARGWDAATAAIRAQWPAAIRAVRVAAGAPPSVPVTVRWNDPSGAIDTIGAILMDGVVSVAPFTRARGYHVPDGVVIARWVDGEPAAVDRPSDGGCVREVAIGNATERLRTALTNRPCGGPSGAPASDSAVRALAGAGPLGASFGAPRTTGDRALMTVLLVLACAAALAELFVRR
jgi:hypothetical protein